MHTEKTKTFADPIPRRCNGSDLQWMETVTCVDNSSDCFAPSQYSKNMVYHHHVSHLQSFFKHSCDQLLISPPHEIMLKTWLTINIQIFFEGHRLASVFVQRWTRPSLLSQSSLPSSPCSFHFSLKVSQNHEALRERELEDLAQPSGARS